MNATTPIFRFGPRFPQNRHMYRIKGFVSSRMIPYMVKAVKSSD